MKNLIYFFALFFAIAFISSCGECPDCPQGPVDETTVSLKDTISEARFLTWVGNWNANGKRYTATTLTESFTMPLIDITEFQQFPGTGSDSVVAARFVLGMEMTTTDMVPHLMLVGVNSAGASLTDASKQQYVYDVTRPCPSMCGINSLPR